MWIQHERIFEVDLWIENLKFFGKHYSIPFNNKIDHLGKIFEAILL